VAARLLAEHRYEVIAEFVRTSSEAYAAVAGADNQRGDNAWLAARLDKRNALLRAAIDRHFTG
jgi:hypothetical protein